MRRPNDEGSAGGLTLPEPQNTSDTEHSASTATDVQMATATVIARALLVGVAVRELPGGSFIATRQGLRWRCADLTAVQALVRRMGGAL